MALGLTLVLLFALAALPVAAGAVATDLTHNGKTDTMGQVNGAIVVWSAPWNLGTLPQVTGDAEIFWADLGANPVVQHQATQDPGGTNVEDQEPSVSGTAAVWIRGSASQAVAEVWYDPDVTDDVLGGRALTGPNSVRESNPKISGKHAVWQQNTSIYYDADVTDGGVNDAVLVATVNAASAGNPSLSGNYLVYASNSDIFYIDLSLGAPYTPVNITGQYGSSIPDSNPCVSGTRVVWQGGVTGNPEIFWTDLSVMPIVKNRLTTESYDDVAPSISGTRVVYTANSGSGGTSELWYANIGSVAPVQLTTDTRRDEFPSISGRYFAWEKLYEDPGGSTNDTEIWYDYAKDVDVRGDTYSTDEDAPLTVVAPGVLGNDDTFPYTITSWGTPANGMLMSSNVNGSFTYMPNADYSGADSFTYSVVDGYGVTQVGTVNITVNAVNDVPSFTKGADQAVNQDAGAQTVAGWATNISAGPLESGQTVDFIVSNSNGALFSAEPAVAADGTLTYTPAAGAYGSATVSVQIHDNGGTTNGGVDTSAIQTFTITVNQVMVNQAPILDSIGDKVGAEGAALTFSLSASDPDGDPVTYSAIGLPLGASLVGADFSWTPGYAQAGDYVVTFYASDGDLEDSETITISVANTNRAPVLDAVGDKDASEGSELAFTLTGSDPDLDTVAFSATGMPAGATLDWG